MGFLGVPMWVWGAGAGLLILLPAKKVVAAIRKTGHGDPEPYLTTIRRAVVRHPELDKTHPTGHTGVSVLVGLFDQESKFDPTARSKTGAAGLGQFTMVAVDEVKRLIAMSKYRGRFDTTTAGRLNSFSKDLAVSDPHLAIEAAALLMAELLRKWKGNVEAALTDYNAGGKAAGIVASAGSHSMAKATLENLDPREKSQSPVYAPEVVARAGYFREHGITGFGNYVRSYDES